MRKWIGALLCATFVAPGAPVWAGDYLFLSQRYLDLTNRVIKEADVEATKAFPAGSPFGTKWAQALSDLRSHTSDVRKARLLKKLKPETVAQTKDEAFAAALNRVKDGLNVLSEQTHKPLMDLLPTYKEWAQVEAAVVADGLDQRLAAYETRYGPESEQINIVEYLIGEAFLHGDEGGPGAWEPIARFAPVQVTTTGSGLVSTAQLGMNYYFVKGAPKNVLGWVASNHVGVAATLQYLRDPRIFRFRGDPSVGLQLHLDKKEVGISWDQNDKTVRMTLGYAFQVIPLAM